MRQLQPSILERIGKALQQTSDSLVHERAPERWIELITRLNAEEDTQRLRSAAQRCERQAKVRRCA